MSKNDLALFNNDFDLFDPFFNDDFFRFPPRGEHHPQEMLRCDVIENENDYELVMDAPGLKKENVSIDIEDGYLTINVLKKEDEETKKKKFVRKERHFFQSKRSFYVGNVDESLVKAKMENGELTITIPKEEKKIINKTKIAID